MTVDPIIEELTSIEQASSSHLDDDSIRLVAIVRSHQLLGDDEWIRIKGFLREALQFLGQPRTTVQRDEDGTLVLDLDADPRNADWLRIATAHRLADHVLPMWASLWAVANLDRYAPPVLASRRQNC